MNSSDDGHSFPREVWVFLIGESCCVIDILGRSTKYKQTKHKQKTESANQPVPRYISL